MKKSVDSYVLDSFAVLALLENEKGADQISKLLRLGDRKQAHLWLSVINMGEVLYIIERERGIEAAHVKARYAVSYADAFAAALAQRV